ncbi:hypothetical protein BLNAU_18192 [Blattamonas nauphoetae]|uniref:Transmembrane protein n=1 Tax=Blattamonas nauphoetae TaxID=2049346 RepID=A0ABQ9X5M9_9EUKA|nr:hypothetical protein BLNAU_18192 [Blattamonas nauphoetae]
MDNPTKKKKKRVCVECGGERCGQSHISPRILKRGLLRWCSVSLPARHSVRFCCFPSSQPTAISSFPRVPLGLALAKSEETAGDQLPWRRRERRKATPSFVSRPDTCGEMCGGVVQFSLFASSASLLLFLRPLSSSHPCLFDASHLSSIQSLPVVPLVFLVFPSPFPFVSSTRVFLPFVLHLTLPLFPTLPSQLVHDIGVLVLTGSGLILFVVWKVHAQQVVPFDQSDSNRISVSVFVVS